MKMRHRFFAEEPGANDGSQSAAPATDSTTSDVDWAEMSNEFLASETEGEFEIDNTDTSAGEQPGLEAKADEVKPAPDAQTPPAKAEETPPAKTAEELAAEAEAQKAAGTTEIPPNDEPANQFDWSEWEKKSITELEKDYQLTPEETQAMLTEPETVLPRMAASVHARVVRNILAHLPQILPPLLHQVTQVNTIEAKLQETFFGVNEDLKDASFAPLIEAQGKLYRQYNPTADAATAAFHVGNMVRQLKGLPLKEKPGATQQTPPTQQAPARAEPFVPAGGSAGSGGNIPNTNPFAQLAEELLEQDNI